MKSNSYILFLQSLSLVSLDSSLYTREPMILQKSPPLCKGAGVRRTPLRSRSTDRGGSRDGVSRKADGGVVR